MQDIYTKILSSKKFRKFGVPIILFILVGASFFVWTSYNRVAEANWWDEKWIYRSSIQVTNNTAQESDVYVEVALDTSGLSIQNDCGDFRFTTNSGTQLPYYIVSGCGTATNVIHINFSSLLAGSQSIYFYYGNNGASNGFSTSDFSTEATNYTIGSVGTQEVGPGPVAYWKFDEAMGTLVNDESGQGHSGTILADNWGHGDDCLVGDCFAIDSDFDGVDVANTSKLNPKNITVQAWLKSTSTEGSIIEKKTTDYGDGSDGSVVISTTTNINTDTIASGRTCADGGDGVSYNVAELTATSALLSFYPSAGCISPGDKIMLINLQGTETNHGNVGNYEFLEIASISGKTITFTEEKTKYYGNATSSDDSNLSEEYYYDDSSRLANGVVGLNVGSYARPVFVDLDDDGDFDMVIGKWDGTLDWYRNVGNNISPEWQEDRSGLAKGIETLDVGNDSFPSFADLDGDGDYDLIIGDYAGSPAKYRNIGTKNSPEWQSDSSLYSGSLSGYYNRSLSFADLDGDGDLDVVAGEADGTLYWHRNTGSSTEAIFSLDSSLASGIESIDVGSFSVPTFADIDGDGDYDLVVGRGDGYLNWYENASSTAPSWTEASSTLAFNLQGKYFGLNSSPAPFFADLNGDNNLDLVVGKYNGTFEWYGKTSYPSSNTQKVMIQRVPQYTSVVIENGASLVAESWDGIKGGVLTFFANSWIYVKSGGTVNANNLGYRGNIDSIIRRESYPGLKSFARENYYGAGGHDNDGYFYNWGGGGYGTPGDDRDLCCGYDSMIGGEIYGDSSLSKIFFGSSGKGSGGGIIYLKASNALNEGEILANGIEGSSGGSIYIYSKKLDAGINKINVNPGLAGTSSSGGDKAWSKGGYGRIHIKSNNILASTTPEAATSSIAISSTSPYNLKISGSKAVFSVTVGGIEYSATSTIDINDNEYNFVTGTYDGETIGLYINGYLDATNTTPSGDIDNSEGGFAVGYGFEYGFIDEVRIYPYATDAEKVLLDYNSGTYLLNSSKPVKVSFGNPNVQTSNPVGYWALDEGSGTKASDHTIENNHGTITDSTWELEASCLIGKCLSMSTTSDQVLVPHHKTLAPEYLTTSAWIKTNNSSGDILYKEGNTGLNFDITLTGSVYKIISSTGSGAGVGSFSTTIPDDADIAIVFVSGQIADNSTMFDILNWDNDTSVDFTSITRGGDATNTFVQSLYMTKEDLNWPGAGSQTLYWSAPSTITYGYNIGVVFYKNVDINDPIFSAQSHRDNTSWTSSLTDVGIHDMGIIAGYNYRYDDGCGVTSGGYVDVDYTGYNQTALWERRFENWGANPSMGIGQELGENELYIWASPAYSNFSAISFAIRANEPLYQTDFYSLKLNGGNPIFKLYNNNISHTATGTTAINDNEWHYVVGTYDGSAMKIYVDGTLEDTNTTITGPLDPSDLGLYIGTNFTSAYIDEVKIYPYARVVGQIQADYASGLAGTTTTRILAASFGDDSIDYKYCVPMDDSVCGTPFLEFDMDEKNGNTLYNAGSDSNNAIFYDGASPATSANWARALVGHAVKFNNSSEYLLYNKDGTDLVGKGMTITGWVNGSDLDSGSYYIIDGREEASPNNGFGLFLQGSNDWGDCDPGDICFWTASTTGGDIAYDGVPHNMTNNKWHHIAATFDKDTYEKVFYVDGVRIGTAIANQGIGDNPDDKITFGKVESGAGPFMIDGFRAYDFLRTPAQIAWDYNKGKPVAYWDFNECQGLIAHNYIANNNHGSLTFGPSGTQTSPGNCSDGLSTSAWYNGRTGKINASLNFDGVDDYIDIGTSSQLTTDCAMTVCAWINPNSIGVNNHILSQSNSAGDESQYFFSITNSNSNSLEFGWGDGIDLEYYYSPESSITTGSWQHVCATRTSGGTEVVLYIDGQSVSTTVTGTSTIPTIPQNLSIGRPGDQNNYYFDGKIDEVKLWRYPLTSGQIRTEYNGGTVSF